MFRNKSNDVINAITDNLVDGKSFTPDEEERINRLKDAHSFWLNHPVYTVPMIRDYLMNHYNVGRTQAYDDISLIKAAFGNIEGSDREFQRYRANTLLEAAGAAALAGNDKKAKALTKVAEAIGKVNRLDVDEGETFNWDDLAPKDFSFTVDPSVIGIVKEQNVERKARKLLERYTADLDSEEKIINENGEEISE